MASVEIFPLGTPVPELPKNHEWRGGPVEDNSAFKIDCMVCGAVYSVTSDEDGSFTTSFQEGPMPPCEKGN